MSPESESMYDYPMYNADALFVMVIRHAVVPAMAIAFRKAIFFTIIMATLCRGNDSLRVC